MRAGAALTPQGGRYEIRLLGQFCVLRDGIQLPDREIGSRKARTLLKRLLVERGRMVGVDALADAVWPEQPPEHAERHIATLVSRLRAALGADAVVRAGEGYRFGGGPDYVVDVDRAERFVVEAESRLAAGEPGLARGAAARALELLDGGEPLAEDQEAAWAAPARAAAAGLLARARHAAWTAALTLGECDEAARVAQAALDDEPYNEDACRALMRAHHGNGAPGLALAAFEQLRETLADELGIDPAEETRSLHLSILRDERLPGASSPAGQASATRSGRPDPELVGRDAELAWLRRAWSDAVAGAAGLVLLVGEAGIGKTRLAGTVVELAEATGATVARTRCYEAERSLFLQPVVDALRPVVVSSSPQLVREAAGPGAGFLAQLIAEVGVAAGSGEHVPASPDVERQRTFEAIVRFIRGLAEHRPLLLFLDDLHVAGSSTVELLHFLFRRVAGSPVLVLGTARVEEGAEVIHTLGDVARQYELGPLPDDAVYELSRRSGVPDLAPHIVARTRGHSLFVVETLRAVATEEGGDEVAAIPESLRTAVTARMRRAGPQVDELLRAAATLGGSFEPSVLAALLDQPVEETVRCADAATRARLLTEVGSGYAFANDLLGEIAYQTTPLPVRVARHRRAAQLLSDNPEAVATHASRAADWPAATTAYMHAADAAARGYANRDAERLLDQALQAAFRTDDHSAVARVRLARGRVREVLADYQGAFEDHSAVVDVARRHDRPHLELAALRQLGGDLLVGMGHPSGACIPYLDRALSLSEQVGDVQARIDILGRLAVIWTNRLDFDRARTYAELAVELADPIHEAAARAVALDATKTMLAYRGDIAELEEVLPQLNACLRQYRSTQVPADDTTRYPALSYPQLQAWTTFESAFPDLARGRWDNAVSRIEDALAISEDSGYTAYEPTFLAHLTWVERARGRYGEALRLGRQAADLAARTGHPWWVAMSGAMLGWALTDAGALDEATDRLRHGLAAAERDATEGYLARCLGHLAWATSLRGDRKDAARLADRAVSVLHAATGGTFLHGAHAALAAAEASLTHGAAGPAGAAGRDSAGDGYDATWRLLEPLRQAASESGWVETVAWADLLRARAQLPTNAAAAAEHAESARALAHQHELPGIEWQAHGFLAGRRPVEWQAHLAAARSIIDQLAASFDDETAAATYRSHAQQRLDSLATSSPQPK